MSATDPQRLAGVLEGYVAEVGRREGAGRDQLVAPDGTVRPDQDLLAGAVESMALPGLLVARAECRRLVDEDAIRYGATPEGGQGRNWVVDPLPVVLSAEEWAGLEAGIQQRAHLLDLVQADLYGPRRLLRSGLVPAEVVLGHGEFVHQSDAVRLPGQHQLVFSAADLVRRPDGSWVALADRTSTPSGAGYAMATRRIVTRVMAGMHRSTQVTRMRGFFHQMAGAMHDVAPTDVDLPHGVVLSPGAATETAYEHAFLSILLGFPLVEAGDLSMRHGHVWVGEKDRRQRVDVILRRVDSYFADPLELRPGSRLGVPGLIDAARRGAVTVVNPVGAGVLENPGLLPFLPTVARELLGEDLQVESAPTWWCGDPTSLDHVLGRLDSLVLKPITRGVSTVPPARVGPLLSAAERTELREQVLAQPWAWVGQDPVDADTAPVVTDAGLRPRRFVLRAFAVARGGEHHVLPGGLGRVAASDEAMIVSNSTGALAKDVWVLAGAEPERPWLASAPRLDERLPVGHGMALPARVAENLYWMGRYGERAESTARLLTVTDDLVEDHANRPDTPGWTVMRNMLDAVALITRRAFVPGDDGSALDPTGYLRDAVSLPVPGTVAYCVQRLVNAAQEVRDQVSRDSWHVLAALEHATSETFPVTAPLRPRLAQVLTSTLAMSGMIAESMVRDSSWGYLDAGVRIERAQLTLALLRGTVATAPSPANDGVLAEAALTAGESLLTHRRRTVAGEGPAWPAMSALALLLTDATNPRSVAFSLARLAEDLRLTGDEAAAGAAEAELAALRGVDLHRVAEGDRTALAETLTATETALRELSDRIAERHFRREAHVSSLPQSWIQGVVHA